MAAKGRMPGDPDPEEMKRRMIRVDHAGEYGALRIYEGQLAVLGRRRVGEVIQKMADGERRHLAVFEKMIVERRVRPTLLSPLWHVAGFALGAGTALMGEKAAMACTVAVEEVIDEHYARQAEALGA
ncbi:MAG: demethoxyubiquinone hydroxylase family protein, partial [Alphaproteobacteria bacterium]